MTKKELLEMLENIKDDEKINFVSEKVDKAGYPQDKLEPDVYKVVGENYITEHVGFGVYRIENKACK
jgi:hypothetical protein